MKTKMEIKIITTFETSYIGENRTIIEAKILTDTGLEICSGTSSDSKEAPASAKRATSVALDQMRRMLDAATTVANKAGLL